MKYITCAQCHQVVPGRTDSGSHRKKFCSVICAGKASSFTRIKSCKTCKKDFEVQRSRWKRKNYCSKICQYSNRSAWLKKTCEHCGVKFERRACQERKKKTPDSFCNLKCFKSHQKLAIRGENDQMKIGKRGQIAIPVRVQRLSSFKPGRMVTFKWDGRNLILTLSEEAPDAK